MLKAYPPVDVNVQPCLQTTALDLKFFCSMWNWFIFVNLAKLNKSTCDIKKTGECCTNVQHSGICEDAKKETTDESRSNSELWLREWSDCDFLSFPPCPLFFFRIFSEKMYSIIVGDIVSRKCNFYSVLGLFSLVVSFCLLFVKRQSRTVSQVVESSPLVGSAASLVGQDYYLSFNWIENRRYHVYLWWVFCGSFRNIYFE